MSSGRRATPKVSAVYRVDHDRRVFREVTLSGTTALVTPAQRPSLPPTVVGRPQMTMRPVAASVFAAVWNVDRLLLSIVPAASYRPVLTGARNVLPTNFRPLRMVFVYQRTYAPVPAAYATAAGPEYVAPVPPLQLPVRAPVVPSILSPLEGMVQVTALGNAPLMALKNAPSAAVASSVVLL